MKISPSLESLSFDLTRIQKILETNQHLIANPQDFSDNLKTKRKQFIAYLSNINKFIRIAVKPRGLVRGYKAAIR